MKSRRTLAIFAAVLALASTAQAASYTCFEFTNGRGPRLELEKNHSADLPFIRGARLNEQDLSGISTKVERAADGDLNYYVSGNAGVILNTLDLTSRGPWTVPAHVAQMEGFFIEGQSRTLYGNFILFGKSVHEVKEIYCGDDD